MRIETIISNNLSSILKKDNSVFMFIEKLSNMGELIFFGGSIRDLYLDLQNHTSPRDYDIVINSSTKIKELEKIIESYDHKKNRFGGYKVKIGSTEFDIWRIEKTWAFSNNLLESKENNLINSVYLSVDGIAYNYNKKKLYDNILKHTNEKKEISVVLKNNPQKELNLLRGLVYKQKYKYSFSHTLKSEYRLQKERNKNLSKLLYDLQFDHYKEEKLTLKQIERELNGI
ncbi:hypothetical protein ACHAL6_03940 [Proteiniclasticum sp. C24MP]|uniref:hypothetical protein n=1 Tax=Proteiniclasticum sp. C24MP TaxID=3374101 RepID=UPI0037551413